MRFRAFELFGDHFFLFFIRCTRAFGSFAIFLDFDSWEMMMIFFCVALSHGCYVSFFLPLFWLWRYVSWVLILLVFLFGNFIFVFISNSFDAFKHADYPFIVVTFQSTFLPLLKCSMSQCCNLFYIANVWILWCVERKREEKNDNKNKSVKN